MATVRLELAAPRSQVKHSATEPLCSRQKKIGLSLHIHSYTGVDPEFLKRGLIYSCICKLGGLAFLFYLIFPKYPTETKLFHFHWVFQNGEWEGGLSESLESPLDPPLKLCVCEQQRLLRVYTSAQVCLILCCWTMFVLAITRACILPMCKYNVPNFHVLSHIYDTDHDGQLLI